MLRRLAARAARRRRRRRASTADVFVSRHTAVPREDVDAYVKSRILPAGGPSQAARVDGSGANLLLKECPSAGFCSPTKYAGTGKPGNDYKFAILRDGGAYFCHRCGGKGSWYDLRLGMSGAVPSSLEGEVQSTPRVRSGDTPRPDAAIAARCPVALFDAQGSEVKRYLNETRGLNDTTLAVYGVGYASRKFRDGERWVDEPCATFPWIQVPDDGPASTVRLKVRSVRTKRHMRVEPAGLSRCPCFFGSRRRRPSFYVVASRTRTPPRRRRDVARFDGITGRGDVIAATSRLRRTSIAETLIVEGVAATLSPRDFTPSSRRRLLFTPSPRAFTSTPSPQDKTPSSTQAATGASSACTRYQMTRPSS